MRDRLAVGNRSDVALLDKRMPLRRHLRHEVAHVACILVQPLELAAFLDPEPVVEEVPSEFGVGVGRSACLLPLVALVRGSQNATCRQRVHEVVLGAEVPLEYVRIAVVDCRLKPSLVAAVVTDVPVHEPLGKLHRR